jgi:hypothetical protein
VIGDWRQKDLLSMIRGGRGQTHWTDWRLERPYLAVCFGIEYGNVFVSGGCNDLCEVDFVMPASTLLVLSASLGGLVIVLLLTKAAEEHFLAFLGTSLALVNHLD